jgi:hypothetical protein
MSGKRWRNILALLNLFALFVAPNLLANQVQTAPTLPIIPCAWRFGITTTAGSGRNLASPQTTIFKVTNLNATGAGTLAA